MSEPVRNSKLISPEYQKQQQELHDTVQYGGTAIIYAPIISGIINKMGVQHVLDYGCGEGVFLYKYLKADHKLKYQAYDPGVSRFSKRPVPAEMVCCIDVLEHIEPEYLDNVLDDLCSLTEAIAFLSITMAPALKTLPDGRNAHLIVEPMKWWLPKILDRWDVQTVQAVSDISFFVICQTKVRLEAQNGKSLV